MLQDRPVNPLVELASFAHVPGRTITLTSAHDYIRSIYFDPDPAERAIVSCIARVVAQGVLMPQLFSNLGEAIVDIVEGFCVIVVAATAIREIFQVLVARELARPTGN